jgi:hypothetical protein
MLEEIEKEERSIEDGPSNRSEGGLRTFLATIKFSLCTDIMQA